MLALPLALPTRSFVPAMFEDDAAFSLVSQIRHALEVSNWLLGRSTSSISTPQRRISLAAPSHNNGTSFNKSGLSVGAPMISTTPLSASPRNSTPAPGAFPIRYGRATILTVPPKLVAVVETPDVAVGAVDPRKRHVVTATQFSSRAGANGQGGSCFSHFVSQAHVKRVIFASSSVCLLIRTRKTPCPPTNKIAMEIRTTSNPLCGPPSVDIDHNILPLTGAWGALGEVTIGSTVGVKGLLGELPPKSAGLATPEKIPMSMQLSHEEIVIG